MADFQGRAVIVTGGAGGIGRAIATGFCRRGASAVIADIDGERARAAAVGIEHEGGQALAVQADLARSADVDDLFEAAVGKFGGVDVLVNNAGITFGASVLDLPEAQWDRVIDVNLKSYFLCSQRAARLWTASGRRGRIVNIGSIDAEVPMPEHLAYCVSKAGVVGLTRTMALALAPYKINVNCINAGLVAGGMLERALADPARAPRLMEYQPWRRLAEPGEVAEAVLFLASDVADFITGSTLTIDGGRTLDFPR